MSDRTLFASGAVGDVIKHIQMALIARGCKLSKADRVFGADTLEAVKQFQFANALSPTGIVDTATWQALMQLPVPDVGDRCLQLTAAFEGHGFELAVGNFDGALLTWGIIGFTMTSGEVPAIIKAINASHPNLINSCFSDHATELLQVMSSTPDAQKQWADAHTLRGGALAEPWKSMFANFGSQSEVQAEQVRRVQQDYLTPAIATARKLGFTSELGLALCFDIHVQNGGIKPAVLRTLLQGSGQSEPERRQAVANAVADSARATWREDVRRRKLTVATGDGIVHGHHYKLANWGLNGEFTAPELAPTEAAATAA